MLKLCYIRKHCLSNLLNANSIACCKENVARGCVTKIPFEKVDTNQQFLLT